MRYSHFILDEKSYRIIQQKLTPSKKAKFSFTSLYLGIKNSTILDDWLKLAHFLFVLFLRHAEAEPNVDHASGKW